ncbi:multidrug efflux pump subunit AcrB [Rhodovulum imhoffii]|uniref:Multidrug efflux pump subunit AcrB n=1 Tax=Rhodovulum imhoffii TaxID=365340 RepID=A0A2T5BSN8_9RHOB|nr:efflux RND transporter permease subunit [Rhodovulum imhoffii]MBK5933050.1 ACR family transporter [Rhodovulum imhoffii]PTN02362.1 multidrug efflux pump subunit AcrB [Rhodovulum imhoffii]
MKRFNLSDWALQHRSFVWFLMIVSVLAGALAYTGIGREEDPDFAIKTMIVSAALPGADVQQTLTQVTDRIEKKLSDLPELDYTESITRPGESIVYIELRPDTHAGELPRIWQQVRNMMADIRDEFPAEFAGFRFNDDFGDVFGNLYAFTSDGFTRREIRDYAEDVRRIVQQIEDAGKVELFGTREEVIYLEFDIDKLAALGLDQKQVQETLAAQNAILPSGVIDAGPERVLVRIGGDFTGTGSLLDVNLRVADRFFRLSDVASIRRDYADPPEDIFRFNGREAIGMAVGMRTGANILDFGAALTDVIEDARRSLPVGVEIHQVADQPQVVDHAVNHFLKALAEAVLIVLAVSFISLGWRAGLVVTTTVPLVLALTFVFMHYTGFTLQRVSLGALIIALGLLVDDAMIAIETMISRLEKGEGLTQAASYAWTSIAFPMLSGTLVTMAGFIPIGLNDSAAGEFTFSLFVVIAVSLLISWGVAVLFAPLLGVSFLPKTLRPHAEGGGIVRRTFHKVLRIGMTHRWVTIGLTVAAFGLSVYGMRFVEQQFFPNSDRPELIVDVRLPQNASITETQAQMDRLEAHLKDNPHVAYWTSYVGRTAPRFILAYDVLTPAQNTGQVVIQSKSVAARDALRTELQQIAREDFPGVDLFVKLLEIGPPVGRPVQYRLSGPDIDALRDHARDLAALVARDTRLTGVVLDWNEPVRVVAVDILHDRARQLGLTSRDIAATLYTIYDGVEVTELRDADHLIGIVARGDEEARRSVEALENLQLSTGPGGAIPLRAVANFRYETEQPVIHQRNRVPTITVQAALATGDQPATVVNDLAGTIAAFADTLPHGYHIAVGGSVEESAESQGPIARVVPLMTLIMLTLIMIQMQGFRLGFVVLCVAPLGLIGVVVALLSSGAPLGFVAILGVLALVGILIRNSIILVCEIEVLRGKGMDAWNAVFHASDSRARPILLTAAAASLALIPISRQIFWGPMAYAMMGGIIAGTLITLIFVPALYLAVFRVKRPSTSGHAGSGSSCG